MYVSQEPQHNSTQLRIPEAPDTTSVSYVDYIHPIYPVKPDAECTHMARPSLWCF